MCGWIKEEKSKNILPQSQRNPYSVERISPIMGQTLHTSSAALISKEFTEQQSTSCVNQSINQQKCSRSDISKGCGHMSFTVLLDYIASNSQQSNNIYRYNDKRYIIEYIEAGDRNMKPNALWSPNCFTLLLFLAFVSESHLWPKQLLRRDSLLWFFDLSYIKTKLNYAAFN